MSRRDVIIISVLVNAALLAVLFLTAIKSDSDTASTDIDFEQVAVADETVKEVSLEGDPIVSIQEVKADTAAPMDEVDHVLKEYLPEITAETVAVEETPAPVDAPVVVKEAEPTPTNENYVEVTVKRGDALEKIARANRTSIAAIKKANNMANDKLKIGQVLKVPVGTVKAKTEKVAAAAATVGSDPVYYTVKKGDNPWKIAKQNNVKFEDLLKLNNLNEEKAKNLKVGDTVRVR